MKIQITTPEGRVLEVSGDCLTDCLEAALSALNCTYQAYDDQGVPLDANGFPV